MLNRNERLDKTIASLETINTGASHIGENVAGLVESIFDGVFDSALLRRSPNAWDFALTGSPSKTANSKNGPRPKCVTTGNGRECMA